MRGRTSIGLGVLVVSSVLFAGVNVPGPKPTAFGAFFRGAETPPFHGATALRMRSLSAGALQLRRRGDEAKEANPYGVEFRDVTRAAGIHFHHERAESPKR